MSGLYRGSQFNQTTLTKEAYTIFMSDDDADMILRSDHLPLKRFFEKNTLNSNVNNWAVEIEQYLIKFE